VHGPPPLREVFGAVEHRVLGKGRLCGDEVGALLQRTRKAKKIATMIKISEKERSIQPPGWSEELVGKGEALTRFMVPSLGSIDRSRDGGHEYDAFTMACATQW
jgi:hypothetical protein